jgi:integrase
MAHLPRVENCRISKAGIYEVQLYVPPKLRTVIGSRWLVESTGSRDYKEAKKQRDIIVGKMRERLKAAEAMAVPMVLKIADTPRQIIVPDLSPEAVKRIQAIITGEFPDALVLATLNQIPKSDVRVPVPADHAGPVYLPESILGEKVIDMPLAGCTFAAVVELWANEKQKDTKSKGQLLGKLERLARFLGHCDITRVTARDLQRYKESLVEDMRAGQLGSTTCKDHIEMLRAIFRYAWDNHKLPDDKPNPMERIRWDGGDDGRTAEVLDFTDAERSLIIRAALATDNPAIRWPNLIAGYSGARLAEIVEASTADIVKEDGVWMFWVRLDHRPKEQRIKTGFSKRRFAIHSAVIAAGFLDYVATIRAQYRGEGPLFPMLTLYKGRRNTKASKDIMAWLRKLGIADESELQLRRFHSWRHTIATLLTNAKVHPARVRYIAGHAPADKHEGYIHHSAAELRDGIQMLPTVTRL